MRIGILGVLLTACTITPPEYRQGFSFWDFVGTTPASKPHWKAAVRQPERHATAGVLMATAGLLQINNIDREWQRHIAEQQALPGSEEAKMSDIGFFALVGSSLIAPVLFEPHPERGIWKWRYVATNTYALLLNAGVNGIVRHSNIRRRPSNNRGSFYSGHTAGSFAAATLLNREYGPRVGVPAYAVATLVGGYRIEGDYHWPGDVFFGAGAGIFFANLIYEKNHGDDGLHATWGKSATLLPLIEPDRLGLSFSYTW